jgi:murein DD-endopeptidase MepM/ murein hydrolase activator NlpD
MSEQLIPALIRETGLGAASHQSEQLQNRIRGAATAPTGQKREELKKAAQEFEGLFISYLLKVMRETIEESGLTEGGLGKGIYTDLFDQEISRDIGRRGALGISDLLLKSLSEGKAAPDSISPFAPAHPDQKTSPPPAIDPGMQRQDEPDALDSSEEEIPDFRLPVQAPVSSLFGPRKDPFTREIRFHKGLDLAAPEGTPVHAAVSGEVIFAGYENGYGNTVVVQHTDGLQTRYAHLGKANVKRGETITGGQVLGVVGTSGHSTGPHLHFEVIRWGEQIDPNLTLAD